MRTRVGYAGGTSANPMYYSLGDHSETIEIDYDPARISYGELLDVFWDSHMPVYPPDTRQYMSLIFYHNDEQKRLAGESRDGAEARLGRRVYTGIVPASTFYPAEDYHQKYRLQQVPELMKDLTAIYPDIADLTGSTAAARINGYVGGYGTLERLQAELDGLGLSPEGAERLLEIVGAYDR